MKITNDIHGYDCFEAKKYGIGAASLLFSIRFWLRLNKEKAKHIYDGRVWMYNTAKDFSDRSICLTESQVYRIITKLERIGILVSSNYNKMKYDRTKWYTINEPEFIISQDCKMENANSSCPNDNSIKPIPDTYPGTPISKDIGVGMDTDLRKVNSLVGKFKQKNRRRVSKTSKPIEYKFWFNLFREVNDAEVTENQKRRDMIASALQIFTEEELEDIIRFRGKNPCWQQYGPDSEVHKRSFKALFQSKEKLTEWYDKMINAKKISQKNKQLKQTEGHARGTVWYQGM